ncbi:DNA polymerase III subunit alpha [Providencia rettgeri]|uniref:DNA polymerase III subunit alpha n=1 Tax=Providencia rettgeri TaxID=587 RepID=A0A379FUP4_PRORE|nr:DNA polymerase III subunit alpha [Providencia rettgeri]
MVGLVLSAKVITTKRGNRIGICTLDDRSGRLDIMLFSDALDKYQHMLEKDNILIATGQVSFDDFNGGNKMTVRELMDISEAREKYARGLAISLSDKQINDQLLNRLRSTLEPHRSGTIPVHLYYQKDDARAKLKFGVVWRVTPVDPLLNDLRTLLGSEQVELEFD